MIPCRTIGVIRKVFFRKNFFINRHFFSKYLLVLFLRKDHLLSIYCYLPIPSLHCNFQNAVRTTFIQGLLHIRLKNGKIVLSFSEITLHKLLGKLIKKILNFSAHGSHKYVDYDCISISIYVYLFVPYLVVCCMFLSVSWR